MYRSFTILTILFVSLSANLFSQDLLSSRKSGYYTYIFQITDSEMKQVAKEKSLRVFDESWFHTLVDSFPTDSIFNRELPPGNYMKVCPEKEYLRLAVLTVHSFYPVIVSNNKDLVIRVLDRDGTSVADAVLRIRGRRIPFDPGTASYRLPKSGKRGVLEISHNGLQTFYSISNNTRMPRCKEGLYLAGNRSPLQYIWKPVRFIGKIPVDALSTMIYMQPFGIFRRPGVLYHQTACALGSDASCQRINHIFTRKHDGYFVINKPMYLPGDTLFYKAFIVKKRSGKPVNRDVKVHLSTFDKSLDLGELSPYRKGGYHGFFVLDDSLDLNIDRDHFLHLQDRRKMDYRIRTFRMEDYFLSGLNLNIDIKNASQYRGTPYTAELTGRDENNLFVQDGRYEIILLATRAIEYLDQPAFIPDTIATFYLPALPDKATTLELPDSLFPPVNLSYDLDVTLLTSDNRKISSKKTIRYSTRQTEITANLVNDSVIFALEENGIRRETEGAIYSKKGDYEEFSLLWKGTLPVSLRIDPATMHYRVDVPEETKRFSLRYGYSSMVAYTIIQQGDSQFVEIKNPRKLPLVWFIYHRNREISRGEGDDAYLLLPFHRKPELSASVNWLWAGEISSGEAYAFPKRTLEVEVSQPEMTYPGQEVTIGIQVKDKKGNPVPDADITSYAFTRKFEQSHHLPPFYEKPYRYRLFLNRFRLADNSDWNTSRRLDYQTWKSRAALDTIEWYRFSYPEETIYNYSYRVPDSITQIAPYVFKNGVFEPVHVVYIDRLPVFFRWSSNRRPYSFNVSEGYHKVELRLTEHHITIDSVYVKKGEKLILSLDLNATIPGVTLKEMPDELTNAEKRALYHYIFPYRNTFPGLMPYLKQDDQITELSQESYYYGTYLAGPVRPGVLEFILPDSFSMQFYHERNFRYHFSPKILRMECYSHELLYPGKFTRPYQREFGDIKDRVTTEKAAIDRWEKDKERRLRNSDPIILSGKISASAGRLVVEFVYDKRFGNTLLILLFNTDMNSWQGIYGGLRSHFYNLEPGNYVLYGLQGNGNYIKSDTLVVKPNGINFYHLNNYDIISDDSLARCFDVLLAKLANRRTLGPYELIDLLHGCFGETESLQELSTNTRVIDGFVRDGNGAPMPFVNVMAKDSKIGVVTDMYGFFRINLPEGVDWLVFSFAGYVTAEHGIPSVRSTVTVVLYPTHSPLRSAIYFGELSLINADQKSVFYVSATAVRANLRVEEVQSLAAYSVRSKSNFGRFRYASEGIDLEEESSGRDFKFEYLEDDLLEDSLPGLADNTTFAGFDMASASSIRSNFSDYAYWQPVLTTDRNGRASFTVTMPDDVTAWNTHHLVMTGKKQSGYSVGVMQSYKPLMAQLNVPRFMTEGDTAWVTGTIANHTGDSAEVTRSFEADDVRLFSATATIKHSLVDTFMLTASGNDSLWVLYRIDRSDGYFDGEKRGIPLVKQGMQEITATFNILDNDSLITLRFGTTKGDVNLRVYADIPAMLGDELERLINYKYDCNEQLASKLIGCLIKQNMGLAVLERIRNEGQINRTIKALIEGRNSDGLWGWWKGNSTSWWITEHVIYALKKAEKAGYKVSLTEYPINAILLVKMGNPLNEKEALTMVRCFRMMNPGLQNETADKLLSISQPSGTLDLLRRYEAEQLAGRRIPADSILMHKRETFSGEVWFGRDTISGRVSRDELLATQTAYRLLASRTDVKPEVLTRIRAWMLKYRSMNYLNTYEHSLWLDALALNSADIAGEVSKPVASITGTLSETVTEFPYNITLQPSAVVSFRKESGQMILVSTDQRSWIRDPEPSAKGLSVETHFEDNATTLKAGREIRLLVNVVAEKDAEYVMIEVPIPAAAVYGQLRITHPAESYREQYKESTTIFCENLKQGRHTFTITLLPRFTGSYILNPAQAQLMYIPAFNGNNRVKTVLVE